MVTFKENFDHEVLYPLKKTLGGVIAGVASNRWDKDLRKYQLDSIESLLEDKLKQIKESR